MGSVRNYINAMNELRKQAEAVELDKTAGLHPSVKKLLIALGVLGGLGGAAYGASQSGLLGGGGEVDKSVPADEKDLARLLSALGIDASGIRNIPRQFEAKSKVPPPGPGAYKKASLSNEDMQKVARLHPSVKKLLIALGVLGGLGGAAYGASQSGLFGGGAERSAPADEKDVAGLLKAFGLDSGFIRNDSPPQWTHGERKPKW